jgi:hypothetical protein
MRLYLETASLTPCDLLLVISTYILGQLRFDRETKRRVHFFVQKEIGEG